MYQLAQNLTENWILKNWPHYFLQANVDDMNNAVEKVAMTDSVLQIGCLIQARSVEDHVRALYLIIVGVILYRFWVTEFHTLVDVKIIIAHVKQRKIKKIDYKCINVTCIV